MGLKKKPYDITFKLKAIQIAEKTSKEAAAGEYSVDPKEFMSGAPRSKNWLL